MNCIFWTKACKLWTTQQLHWPGGGWSHIICLSVCIDL